MAFAASVIEIDQSPARVGACYAEHLSTETEWIVETGIGIVEATPTTGVSLAASPRAGNEIRGAVREGRGCES